MSVAEETIKKSAPRVEKTRSANAKPIINRVLDVLSSVRFGVILLIILGVLSLIGMLVVQQNVDGFERFYAAATPAEKLIYASLGFYDIYHAWYFNFLLLILSLNIVLASIDRFPTAWIYVVKPKIEATKAYLLNQKYNAQIENSPLDGEKVSAIFKQNGLTTRTTKKENGRVIVFGQKNVWNRLGAYIVHVALLLLFLGHFVALQTGYDADVRLQPGQITKNIDLINYKLDQQERSEVTLPFTIVCNDIEQKLIDKNGSSQVSNTLDWFTRMTIDDPIYGRREISVSLNQPYTYRGFRFFQASFDPTGNARQMTLRLTPETGGEPLSVELQRGGAAILPDGTRIQHLGFFGDFVLQGGAPATRSQEYRNPAAQIRITPPNGEAKTAYAFANELPSGAPVGAPVFGYKYKLESFEKSPLAHILSIKYDPFYGATVAWYIGGGLLMFALCFVFFLAHQRVWAILEPNGTITLGGHTNRNEFGFSDKFEKIKMLMVNR